MNIDVTVREESSEYRPHAPEPEAFPPTSADSVDYCYFQNL